MMGLIVKEKRIWRELCQVYRPTNISFSVVGDKVLFLQYKRCDGAIAGSFHKSGGRVHLEEASRDG